MNDKTILVLKTGNTGKPGGQLGNKNAAKNSEWKPTGDYSVVPVASKKLGYASTGYKTEMEQKEHMAWGKAQIAENAEKHGFTKSVDPQSHAYYQAFKGNKNKAVASVTFWPQTGFRSGGSHAFATPLGGNSTGFKEGFFDTADEAFEHAKNNIRRIKEDDANER